MTDTNHMTAKQSAYQVGTTVEVQMYDFKAPGQPLRWFTGVIEAVEQRDGKGKLVDVLVRMSDDGRPRREIVGPRGGNNRIRVAS